MAAAELDLEMIVREVLRRLEQAGDEPGGDAAPRGAATRAPAMNAEPAAAVATAVAPPTVPQPTVTSPADRPAHLDLGQHRTITLGLIEGRLTGVRELLVSHGAVVTPSVRDELRARGVGLRFADRSAGGLAARSATHAPSAAAPSVDLSPTAASATSGRLVLGVAQAPYAAVAAAAVRTESPEAEQIDHDCVLEVIRQTLPAVVEQGRISVVLTERPAVALCLANRTPGVRAAWGVSVAAVREAARLIGTNLLVIHPGQHSLHEVRSMVREFVGGRHDCPKGYRRTLGEPR